MRLIDADEYRKRIDHYPPDIRDIAKKELRYVKTIDAEPVKHGRWIKQKYEDTDGSTIYGWECSVCGEGVVWRTDDDLNIEKFCYNCGTKMDLEEVKDNEAN